MAAVNTCIDSCLDKEIRALAKESGLSITAASRLLYNRLKNNEHKEKKVADFGFR